MLHSYKETFLFYCVFLWEDWILQKGKNLCIIFANFLAPKDWKKCEKYVKKYVLIRGILYTKFNKGHEEKLKEKNLNASFEFLCTTVNTQSDTAPFCVFILVCDMVMPRFLIIHVASMYVYDWICRTVRQNIVECFKNG